jgi:hypothetical protein
MVRRAFLSFLPAALAALAVLCATPGTGVGEASAASFSTASSGATSSSAASWNARTAATPIARGSLTQDLPDGALNPRADQDDTPDDRIIIRVVSTIVWPGSALEARILDPGERAGPSHRPCAAPPRAPPTA